MDLAPQERPPLVAYNDQLKQFGGLAARMAVQYATTQMLIHELTPAECREVLGRATYGRLGCAQGEQPYVVPFVFRLDPSGSCLYSFSTVGQKINWMRENPKVCVEVDEVGDQHNWTSVLALGRYEEIRDPRHDEDLRRQANDLFQHRSAWWFPPLGKLTSGEEHYSPVVFRILIDRVTGRRASSPVQTK